jgi:hypothetical protein
MFLGTSGAFLNNSMQSSREKAANSPPPSSPPLSLSLSLSLPLAPALVTSGPRFPPEIPGVRGRDRGREGREERMEFPWDSLFLAADVAGKRERFGERLLQLNFCVFARRDERRAAGFAGEK